ncbi:hypothetical protein MBLNU13_g08449t1 [Cladosporium sp. NU13]
MAPKLRSQVSASNNDSSTSKSDRDSESSSRPASIKSSPPPAKKAAAEDEEQEEEDDDERVSLPASSFEGAALRASRQGKGVEQSSSRLSSEYDSEDIIIAPRRPPSESDNMPSDSRRDANTGSSDLSDLGATPEPVDPELVRLAGEEGRRKLQMCECESWCTCERYKDFYGLTSYDEVILDAEAYNHAPSNDKAKSGSKRKRVATDDTETHSDKAQSAAKKSRTSITDTPNEDYENDFGSLLRSNSQFSRASDANYRSRFAVEGDDSDLPSQTHLSERVLANEQFEESSMRSTLNTGKSHNVSGDKRDAKKPYTEKVYSWDRGEKPMRPPSGWVGGEWIGGRGKGKTNKANA